MTNTSNSTSSEFPETNLPSKLLAFGEHVKKHTFGLICRKYIETGSPSQFIKELMSVNEELGETLILFNKPIEEAGNIKKEIDLVIDNMYRHYVINTDGPIPTIPSDLSSSDSDDHFDVFKEATEYAKMINVGVSKSDDGTSILHINGKEIPCPSWGVISGKTAAYSLRKVGPIINKVRYGRNDVLPSSVFGFDEKAQTHTLKNAMTLADIAHLAYLNPDYIESQLTIWKYDFFEWIENKDVDTQSFIAGKDNHIVVCFRGTASRTDWITDANLFKTDSRDGKGRVHRGFKKALDGVWDQIAENLSSIDRDKKIYFIGHSLGAALAQLAAYRQATLDVDRIAGVYVYGSPRIGNKDYKEAYDILLSEKTFMHINNTDLVTRVPPSILGYRHMGGTPLKFDLTHKFTSEFVLPVTGSQEVERIDQLDENTQTEIRQNLRSASNFVEDSTMFLEISPDQLQDIAYETTLESGSLDEHGADQYLFKLGCAIIDKEFQKLIK